MLIPTLDAAGPPEGPGTALHRSKSGQEIFADGLDFAGVSRSHAASAQTSAARAPQTMTTYPTSRDGRSRPETASAPSPTLSVPEPGQLWPTDQRLLALLAEHQVLTSGQLVSLAGLPERTVQHRLGRLCRVGLINRSRPPASIGTSPYRCWLTAFGAAAIGAKSPEPWSDDPVGVLATAALSDLWLAVRDHGPTVGVNLQGWRRLKVGVDYEDPSSGAARTLPVEAELTVSLDAIGGRQVAVLVVARAVDASVARVQAVLARFAAYLQAHHGLERRPVLALLVPTDRHAARLLGIVDGLAGAPAARRLSASARAAARERIVVGVIRPSRVALTTAPVWCSAVDGSWRCLPDVLAATAASCR